MATAVSGPSIHIGSVWVGRAISTAGLRCSSATIRLPDAFSASRFPVVEASKREVAEYLSTPMTASRGGSIWIDLQAGKGYVLMRFRDGHFTTYRRWRGLEPLIVGASGNLWLTGRHGHPLVFSPSTGRTYKLREHGGSCSRVPTAKSATFGPHPLPGSRFV